MTAKEFQAKLIGAGVEEADFTPEGLTEKAKTLLEGAVADDNPMRAVIALHGLGYGSLLGLVEGAGRIEAARDALTVSLGALLEVMALDESGALGPQSDSTPKE